MNSPFPSAPPESAHGAPGVNDIRHGGPERLSLALMDARNHTLHLLSRFEEAAEAGTLVVPPRAETELPQWVAGHIGWLSEYWIARNPQLRLGPACPGGAVRLASIEPQADRWFDPALAPHKSRWQLDLPGFAAVRSYLLETLETTLELLEKAPDDDAGLYFFRMALFHEDWRGEQLVTLAQTLGLPLKLALPASAQSRTEVRVPGARWLLGLGPEGFALDIERGVHAVEVPEFEIDAQAVNWSQYVEFIDDGGYDRPELWQAEGWRWMQQLAVSDGRRGPRHVDQIGAASGAVMQQFFGKPARMAGSQCAMHVSWWEADAWARWAGRRLPTEVEWEMAVQAAGRRGFRWGEVREWTAGSLRPWPGFAPDSWTRGSDLEAEPNFGRAKVLRGASFATRSRMKHPKSRSFALPERDDGFVGFRTCSL